MTGKTDTGSHCPALDIDPFSAGFLTDPYSYHPLLRKAGPVVRLTHYDIYAMARYNEVKTALDDWETFCSSRGGGISDFKKEKPWRPWRDSFEFTKETHRLAMCRIPACCSIDIGRRRTDHCRYRQG